MACRINPYRDWISALIVHTPHDLWEKEYPTTKKELDDFMCYACIDEQDNTLHADLRYPDYSRFIDKYQHP